jgi:uncharacterized protein YjbI with pentapeptide repeats
VTVAESVLSSGNFEGASLLGAKFMRCDFSKQDKLYGLFPPTNFRNSTLYECVLTGSMFTEACFDGATIRKTHFAGAVLERAILGSAIIEESTAPDQSCCSTSCL